MSKKVKLPIWQRLLRKLKTKIIATPAWFGKHWFEVITIYISLYMLSAATYSLNLSVILTERTSIENLIATGHYEAALRRYREASLMKLVNKPALYFPLAIIQCSTPNKEPLWILIRAALHQHATNYTIKGFPKIGGPYRSGSPGTPDKYMSINLADVDLSCTKLCDCDFTLIDLYRANLQGSDLRGSDFSKAFLLETDLRNCNLGTDLEDSHQLTRLYTADSNQILYELVKSQLIERSAQDVEKDQRFYIDNQHVEQWILQLDNPDWTIRYNAICGFLELPNYEKNEALAVAINDLFKQEVLDTVDGKEYVETSMDKLEKTSDRTFINGLSYKRYFIQLLRIVAEKGDTSILPILVTFNVYADDSLINAFLVIGEPIIDPLINTLHTGNPNLKISTANLFGNMLWKEQKNYIKDEALRTKIINALVNEFNNNTYTADSIAEWKEVVSEYSIYLPYEKPMKEKDWFKARIKQKYWLKRHIIRAFSLSQDKHSMMFLKEIASNDMWKKDPDGKILYPLRKQAGDVIDNLKNTNKQ